MTVHVWATESEEGHHNVADKLKNATRPVTIEVKRPKVVTKTETARLKKLASAKDTKKSFMSRMKVG